MSFRSFFNLTSRMAAILVKPNSEALRNPHGLGTYRTSLTPAWKEKFLRLPVYPYCKSSRWQEAAHRRESERVVEIAIVIQLAFGPVEPGNGPSPYAPPMPNYKRFSSLPAVCFSQKSTPKEYSTRGDCWRHAA